MSVLFEKAPVAQRKLVSDFGSLFNLSAVFFFLLFPLTFFLDLSYLLRIIQKRLSSCVVITLL